MSVVARKMPCAKGSMCANKPGVTKPRPWGPQSSWVFCPPRQKRLRISCLPGWIAASLKYMPVPYTVGDLLFHQWRGESSSKLCRGTISAPLEDGGLGSLATEWCVYIVKANTLLSEQTRGNALFRSSFLLRGRRTFHDHSSRIAHLTLLQVYPFSDIPSSSHALHPSHVKHNRQKKNEIPQIGHDWFSLRWSL